MVKKIISKHDADCGYAYFRDELKGKVSKGEKCNPDINIEQKWLTMVAARKIPQILIGLQVDYDAIQENLGTEWWQAKIKLVMHVSGIMIMSWI